MPRPTKQQMAEYRGQMSNDVLPLIIEHFHQENTDRTQNIGQLEHDGWYYSNFVKTLWPDGYYDILIERVDLIPGRPIYRKRNQINEVIWVTSKTVNLRRPTIFGNSRKQDEITTLGEYQFYAYQRNKR